MKSAAAAWQEMLPVGPVEHARRVVGNKRSYLTFGFDVYGESCLIDFSEHTGKWFTALPGKKRKMAGMG